MCVAGWRIVRVGRWRDLSRTEAGRCLDLGETILLPGLVNAHCHLDYTAMAGQIPPPRSFTGWIKSMVTLKASWSDADFARSWRQGARMLLRHGVTTVADVEAVPGLIPGLWEATPLKVISFRELLSVRRRAGAEAAVQRAAREWRALPRSRKRVGLSPHAPYSTCGELLRAAARTTGRLRWPLTTHVAESKEEFDMFMFRKGPLFDWLSGQRDMADCGLGSPVQHLARCRYLSRRLLGVHVNYLDRGDAERLGSNGVSVVHCPRSHAYFGHDSFPRAELAAAGVNLCLGTDSLVTVARKPGQPLELDLFAEMQSLARQFSRLAPETIVKMATVNGAKALGRPGEIGQLSAGARADLIAIPSACRRREAWAAALWHAGPVGVSMIDGRWAVGPGDSGHNAG